MSASAPPPREAKAAEFEAVSTADTKLRMYHVVVSSGADDELTPALLLRHELEHIVTPRAHCREGTSCDGPLATSAGLLHP